MGHLHGRGRLQSLSQCILRAQGSNILSQQRTVKFINDEASSIHGNLRVGSIYTSESGEWKLGGFEILSNVKDDDAIIYVRSLDADCGLIALQANVSPRTMAF